MKRVPALRHHGVVRVFSVVNARAEFWWEAGQLGFKGGKVAGARNGIRDGNESGSRGRGDK